MKLKLTISIISSTMLMLLTPTSLKAQPETAYGTSRQPATCPSRSEPSTGRISSAQAIKYATCDAEGDQVVPSPGIANFLEILSLQVSHQGALADYNLAIQLDNPNDAPSYAERGVLKLIRLKDRPGAIKDLEQAAKLYRQDGNTKGYNMVLKAIQESKNQ
jgi:tetratricopeptide (TPR) repeat protein